ncbi:unnamed protein product [Ascophyllum nodosum]
MRLSFPHPLLVPVRVPYVTASNIRHRRDDRPKFSEHPLPVRQELDLTFGQIYGPCVPLQTLALPALEIYSCKEQRSRMPASEDRGSLLASVRRISSFKFDRRSRYISRNVCRGYTKGAGDRDWV